MKIIRGIISLTILISLSIPQSLVGQLNTSRQELKEKASKRLTASLRLIQKEQYDEAKSALDEIYSRAVISKDSFLVSGALGNLALREYHLGNFNESILLYKESAEYDKALKDSINFTAKLKSIGISYRQMGNHKRAFEYYNEALRLAEILNSEEERASISNGIGNLYKELEQFEKSYDYLITAQQIWEAKEDSSRNAIVLSNIGNALLGLEKVEEAISQYNRSLEIKNAIGNKSSIAITENNLGEAYMKMLDFEQAEVHFRKSLKLRREAGQEGRLSIVFNNLASLEMSRGKFNTAQDWLNSSKSTLATTGEEEVLLENLRLQKELYKKTGNYILAIETDSIYDSLREKVYDQQIVQVQKLQFDFDLEQKDKEQMRIQNDLDLLVVQSENRRIQAQTQRYVIFAITVAIILVSYFAFRLRKKNRHIENLMRELHHRVKNHLGMISGMFGAQSLDAGDNSDLLEEARARVEAVNGIHRRLYQDEYEFVNMQEYLTELVDNSALVFGLYQNFHKELKIDSEPLEIDKAISVGLIANEVLTNAFKYGLQQADEPMLKVVLEKVVKGYRMVISNNAAPDQKPITESTGFGKELIKRLTTNLKGESRTIQQNGFQFELTFP